MAEGPEVETLVHDLREAVVGRTILVTEVSQTAAVRFPSVQEFTALLTDRLILKAQRRVKYILLPLSGDLVLAIHLALWGTVALVPSEQPRLPETLIIWRLDQDQDLRLIDKLGYARAAVGPTVWYSYCLLTDRRTEHLLLSPLPALTLLAFSVGFWQEMQVWQC